MKLWRIMQLAISLALCAAPLIGYSQTQDETQVPSIQALAEKYQGYKFGFNLPINVYNKNINLRVQIPQDMKFIHETRDFPHLIQFGNSQAILTIVHQTGGKYQAPTLMNNYLSNLEKNKTDFKILEKNSNTHEGYSDEYRLISTQNKDEDTSLIYVYAISGPYDSALVQYAMKVPNSSSQVITMVKLKNAVKENIKIITPEGDQQADADQQEEIDQQRKADQQAETDQSEEQSYEDEDTSSTETEEEPSPQPQNEIINKGVEVFSSEKT